MSNVLLNFRDISENCGVKSGIIYRGRALITDDMSDEDKTKADKEALQKAKDIIKKLKAGASSFSELNTVLFEGGDNPNISLVQTESREGMSSNAIKYEQKRRNIKEDV